MYCVKCGVELADTEKICPLCKTAVCHPDFFGKTAESEYPLKSLPDKEKQSRVACFIISAVFLIALFIIPLCDLQFDKTVDWAGFATGGILLLYEIFVLPFWFKKPNPVIFVPCGFASVAAYLFYVCFATSGNWFLTFALPVVFGLCLIVTAVVALLRYVRKGRLFIFGGAGIALGVFMFPIELLLNLTFDMNFVAWSMYPLICLVLIGGLLIFLGIYRPAREIMEQKFFF